jgi:hypothetical protein
MSNSYALQREHVSVPINAQPTRLAHIQKTVTFVSTVDQSFGTLGLIWENPEPPRVRNRYIVNFTDHRTNCCSIFAVKTKDEAAPKFQDV